MPRDGARILDDLVGRLENLEIVCPKCHRRGRYAVRRLVDQHGRDFKVPDWIGLMTRDCPRRRSAGLADACAAQCPDLLKLSRLM